MRGPGSGISREKAIMLALWALGMLACVLGLAVPPSDSLQPSGTVQALDVVRVVCTAALAVVLVLGPGLLCRASHKCELELGFLPLPGLALLACTGGLAWTLANQIDPWVVCLAVFAPVMAWLLAGVFHADADRMLQPDERRALLVVGCVLGLVIARGLWSLGPSGELYSGSISRTLEVGDRSDSRIPFAVVQLVAHGTSPYSALGASYFFPYDFSSRGPLAGLAGAPIVLGAGGRPPTASPNQPWTPFDPEGFMAYRLALMTFASTAFLSLWTLARRLAGGRAAHLALLLAAGTPFLINEIWFTWPKLLAASLVLLAGLSAIDGRPLAAGLLVGVGYLVHPGALLFLPVVAGVSLWPLVGARLRSRIGAATLIVAGAAACLVAWRIVNGSHYTQSGFIDYLEIAGTNLHPALWEWLSYRLESISNTLVPLEVFLFFGDDPSINVFGGTSPRIIHFFFQYWTALTFGVGIVFYPLLLISLWRAARRWSAPVLIALIAPFLGFAVYWGASRTGMLREGLQAWVLIVLIVVAAEQWQEGFAWLRSRTIRAVLTLRSGEVLAVAVVPTLFTTHRLVDQDFALTDCLALFAMVGLCLAVGRLMWSEHGT
jgi:hypothetical protein